MYLGTRHKAKSVKMLFNTHSHAFSKVHHRKSIASNKKVCTEDIILGYRPFYYVIRLYRNYVSLRGILLFKRLKHLVINFSYILPYLSKHHSCKNLISSMAKFLIAFLSSFSNNFASKLTFSSIILT